MARVDSLSILLDPSGQAKLAELYDGVIENVQKSAVSAQIKNTDLSGDPEAGSVEAKRFANAESKAYGTARTAGAGEKVKAKPVTIAIDTDKEFVEEIAQKDISLLGVDGLLEKRTANHAQRLTAELDAAFFAEAVSAGTAYVPSSGVTTIEDMVEEAIVTLESLKNDYIDGIDRSMISVTCNPATYSALRKYLDKLPNVNVDTAAADIYAFHGVRVFSSNRLPATDDFVVMMDASIAQPVKTSVYKAEKIPMSEDMSVQLFFHYGTKAVTPETILHHAKASA